MLGALKVATTDQIQRIGAPHLSFRHADKQLLSKEKQARTASHTGAREIVCGLIRTTLCCEPGDSRAPVFALTGDSTTGLAVGVLSGDSGNCTSGGTSFVQPINELLTAYGTVLT
ncbi:hypothetical protein [Streptomyces sp. NPDC059209]|uniref:hypothetical protein n=1 Tax=Streptomyces sp. NPDC059209 TaxID=3346769 RepID=UPI00367FEE15